MSACMTANHFRNFETLSEISTQSDQSIFVYNYPLHKNQAKTKIKSSLCRNYAEKGFCPYGYKCQFAHGLEELRCNIDENSYKTKQCNSFMKKKFCPYGPRCNFSHRIEKEEESFPRKIDEGYRQIIYESRNKATSKLFPLH